MSADKEATAARFRREIGAEFAFIADVKAELIKLFGVKLPVVKYAKRTTFVVGKERRILHIETGSAAIDTGGAAEACSLW